MYLSNHSRRYRKKPKQKLFKHLSTSLWQYQRFVAPHVKGSMIPAEQTNCFYLPSLNSHLDLYTVTRMAFLIPLISHSPKPVPCHNQLSLSI